jgi:hypothetical protein
MSIAKNITLSWVEGYVPGDPDNSIVFEFCIYDHQVYMEFDELDDSITINLDEFQYDVIYHRIFHYVPF